MDRCGTFEQFVAVEQLRLNRAAYLLAHDGANAQDLVQDTLIRLLNQWPKVARADDPYAYARRVMLNVFLGGRRRLWHRELPYADVPDREGSGAYAVVDERDQLDRLLRRMPARQRAAIVLRYWESCTEAETAQALGCSVGNVKSLTSRGLTALRAHAASEESRRKVEETR